MIAIIMGSGDWSDQTVEEIRHTFGNALVKKMYKDFSYKKVLSKGEQEIAGKKYNVENDVYATVKKGQEPKISAKDDQIVIDNGLKTVSPNIKPTSVKDTKAGFFLYSFDQRINRQVIIKHL
jgi:D-alanyl-D-alanine carboxypeptidase